MGHHDPLDGFLTCLELRSTASMLTPGSEPALEKEAADYAAMLHEHDLATPDALGIGGLLIDAARLAQLMGEDAFDGERLMEALLLAADDGLARFRGHDSLGEPAAVRLAFRELGLAIGLSAVERVARDVNDGRLRFSASAKFADCFEALRPYTSIGSGIVSFWSDPQHRMIRSWLDHEDINEVMLASSLIPESCMLAPLC
jgi:hypothetical protein